MTKNCNYASFYEKKKFSKNGWRSFTGTGDKDGESGSETGEYRALIPVRLNKQLRSESKVQENSL